MDGRTLLLLAALLPSVGAAGAPDYSGLLAELNTISCTLRDPNASVSMKGRARQDIIRVRQELQAIETKLIADPARYAAYQDAYRWARTHCPDKKVAVGGH